MASINFIDEIYNRKQQNNNTSELVTKYNVTTIVEDLHKELVQNFGEIITAIRDHKQEKEVMRLKISDFLEQKGVTVPDMTRDELIKKLMDEIFGYSIIQKYIEDPTVNDIMINAYDTIYIRRGFYDELVPEKFDNPMKYRQFLQRVSSFVGEKLNETSPQVDGTDKEYNLRINITAEPINTYNPSLVIRKTHGKISLDEIAKQGNISKAMYDTFKIFGKINVRIMFAGQLESGKTTFMNAYLDHIENQRMVIMEDTPELRITSNANVIYQKTMEGKSEEGQVITLADLVRNFRRTNGTMPVVGETRGVEAVELLNIFNTGFTAGASSIHANSARDVIRQLMFQIKSSGKLGVDRAELEEYIANSIDIIVYMEKRKVVEIVEVNYDEFNRRIVLTPIHTFYIEKEERNSLQGYFNDYVSPFGSVLVDRVRRAGLLDKVDPRLLPKKN